jgi:hypothetical protein
MDIYNDKHISYDFLIYFYAFFAQSILTWLYNGEVCLFIPLYVMKMEHTILGC